MGTIEMELAHVLTDARFRERQARALSVRLGWDGRGGTTLAAAATSVGYTRERVRQLEKRLRCHLVGASSRMPLTVRALDLIEALTPAPRHELAERLVAAGIAERPFDPGGVLRAAELSGLDTRLVESDGLLLRGPDEAGLRSVVSHATRLARGTGAVELASVTAAASYRWTPAETRRLLELEPNVRWLDPERTWLTVPSPRSRPANAIRKMLAVAHRLPLASLDDGLRRSWRPVRLPRSILRAYCATLPWLTVDAETDAVSPVLPLSPERELTPLELGLLELIRNNGPLVRQVDAVRLAEPAGLNPTSTGIYLDKLPMIEAVAPDLYAVRGSVLARATAR